MFLRGKPRSNTFFKIFIREWKTSFEDLKQEISRLKKKYCFKICKCENCKSGNGKKKD